MWRKGGCLCRLCGEVLSVVLGGAVIVELLKDKGLLPAPPHKVRSWKSGVDLIEMALLYRLRVFVPLQDV